MATIYDTLAGVNAYPIPETVIRSACLSHGADADADATSSVMFSKEYKRAKADVLLWLSLAPDSVSDSGQSVSISSDLRSLFRRQAQALLDECDENARFNGFGYKGSNL